MNTQLNHNNRMIIPAPLKIGDTIGVMSPSSYITEDDLNTSIKIVENRGYKTHVHPQTLARHNQSAGTNEEKIDAFHDLIRDPNINAIIFACGGNRAMHWVDDIDFDLVRANPKIIMGFSDCSVPLNIINAKTGLVTFHGPSLRWFMVHADNVTDTEQCFEMLSSPTPFSSSPLYAGIRMRAQGGQDDMFFNSPLVGGNLTLLQYLTNDIDFKNKSLFIEGWNTELSYLDRTFAHMRRQGVFDKINGLIIGQFDNLTDTGRPYGFTLDDIIAEHVPSDLPIIQNAPFGHGERLITLPIGLKH